MAALEACVSAVTTPRPTRAVGHMADHRQGGLMDTVEDVQLNDMAFKMNRCAVWRFFFNQIYVILFYFTYIFIML